MPGSRAAGEAADRRDMGAPPTVLYPLTLARLLQHILTTQSDTLSTTLVICSSRDALLHSLVSAVQDQQTQCQSQSQTQPQPQTRDSLLRLAAPTLHNLFAARRVKVAFCASVQTLLAYLTALKPEAAHDADEMTRSGRKADAARIVLVNPLSLHAATPAFSAQGLSRMFAAAVETSRRVDAVLVVAECQGAWVQPGPSHDEGHGQDGHDEGDEAGESDGTAVDPWEQEVSILNVSAKKFGSGTSDRAWAGRTVKVKRIAARWFHFHKLDELES